MLSRHSICLAIALLFSAQVDDAWAIAPLFPLSSPVVDDDDEYLAGEEQREPQRPRSCQELSVGNLNARTSDSLSSCPERGTLPWQRLPLFFGPSSLYLFMSLQR